MTFADKPELAPGRVYRTRDLSRWSALAVGRLDGDRLRTMAARYATRVTLKLLETATAT